jgi:molecular chaperone DnaK
MAKAIGIDIERMVADAQTHGAEDRQRREEVEARNSADTIAYQVEREIQAGGSRVPANEKARGEQLIAEVRTLVKAQSGDVPRLRKLADDLKQLAAGLATPEPAHAQGPGPSSSDAPHDVVDAEYTRK